MSAHEENQQQWSMSNPARNAACYGLAESQLTVAWDSPAQGGDVTLVLVVVLLEGDRRKECRAE